MFIFFFKQKTAYEMRISDWSSDVCSSDLLKIDELHLRHGLFSGGMSEEMSREVVWRRDAVCVMPYDPRTDQVVLIEQFRAAALYNGEIGRASCRERVCQYV